jgi:uncharacterized BrkB/YihY/UPF0761 family membrane protein
MTSMVFLMIVVLALVMGIGLLLVAMQARAGQAVQRDGQRQYPQGHWMGVGISIGLVIGMGMGLSLGVAIGYALEQKHKDEIRSLTDAEQKARSWGLVVGLAILLLGALVLLGMLVFTSFLTRI